MSKDNRFKGSFEFQESFDSVPARLQVSRAFAESAWSVTVRWESSQAAVSPEPAREAFENFKNSWAPKSGYFSRDFLFSIAEVVDLLYRLVLDANAPRAGLVLVTGATAAAKSQVARGLACRYLQDAATGPGRRPHLVTFENPIERHFCPLDAAAAPGRPVDYTPREFRKDCRSLSEALRSALRQTPTVFYIGEIRDDEDMEEAVTFGGTGHLVVATAHAGNLIEGVAKIQRAVAAYDPGTRAIHLPKVLAVIHLSSIDLQLTLHGGNTALTSRILSALTPTLYRRSSAGMQSLIADGLVSLLPYCPDEVGVHGTLGRQFFARALGERTRISDADIAAASEPEFARAWTDYRRWTCGDGKTSNPAIDYVASDRLVNLALLKDLHGE